MPDVVMKWTVKANKFPAIAANIMPTVELIVAKVANDLQAMMQTLAPVDTGTLKNSIQAIQIGPGHWKVVVGAHYGMYVEWGTVKMAAQPFAQPAVQKIMPAFRAALRKVVSA